MWSFCLLIWSFLNYFGFCYGRMYFYVIYLYIEVLLCWLSSNPCILFFLLSLGSGVSDEERGLRCSWDIWILNQGYRIACCFCQSLCVWWNRSVFWAHKEQPCSSSSQSTWKRLMKPFLHGTCWPVGPCSVCFISIVNPSFLSIWFQPSYDEEEGWAIFKLRLVIFFIFCTLFPMLCKLVAWTKNCNEELGDLWKLFGCLMVPVSASPVDLLETT